MKAEAFLRNVFLFSELTDAELKNVASVSIVKKIPKGQMIFEEGDSGSYFYAVAHGSIKVFRINDNGVENILHIQQNGDLIAEAVLFGIKKYPASCAAIKDSTIVCIPRDGFVDLILKNPKLSIKFMSAYSYRLKEFVEQIEKLSSSVAKRLGTYLIENSEKLSNGKTVCELKISKKDLASVLGTSPETISRTLNDFVKKGFIVMGTGKSIVIKALFASKNA